MNKALNAVSWAIQSSGAGKSAAQYHGHSNTLSDVYDNAVTNMMIADELQNFLVSGINPADSFDITPAQPGRGGFGLVKATKSGFPDPTVITKSKSQFIEDVLGTETEFVDRDIGHINFPLLGKLGQTDTAFSDIVDNPELAKYAISAGVESATDIVVPYKHAFKESPYVSWKQTTADVGMDTLAMIPIAGQTFQGLRGAYKGGQVGRVLAGAARDAIDPVSGLVGASKYVATPYNTQKIIGGKVVNATVHDPIQRVKDIGYGMMLETKYPFELLRGGGVQQSMISQASKSPKIPIENLSADPLRAAQLRNELAMGGMHGGPLDRVVVSDFGEVVKLNANPISEYAGRPIASHSTPDTSWTMSEKMVVVPGGSEPHLYTSGSGPGPLSFADTSAKGITSQNPLTDFHRQCQSDGRSGRSWQTARLHGKG